MNLSEFKPEIAFVSEEEIAFLRKALTEGSPELSPIEIETTVDYAVQKLREAYLTIALFTLAMEGQMLIKEVDGTFVFKYNGDNANIV